MVTQRDGFTMMMDGAGMMAFGWLWLLLVLAGLILIVYVVVRVVRGDTRHGGGERPSAHEVLDERYARGELDDEEYERRRRNLG